MAVMDDPRQLLTSQNDSTTSDSSTFRFDPISAARISAMGNATAK